MTAYGEQQVNTLHEEGRVLDVIIGPPSVYGHARTHKLDESQDKHKTHASNQNGNVENLLINRILGVITREGPSQLGQRMKFDGFDDHHHDPEYQDASRDTPVESGTVIDGAESIAHEVEGGGNDGYYWEEGKQTNTPPENSQPCYLVDGEDKNASREEEVQVGRPAESKTGTGCWFNRGTRMRCGGFS